MFGLTVFICSPQYLKEKRENLYYHFLHLQ